MICPYPGLRPFTQEEAIFLKGRDVHIRQVINQLEERKFVLITGASGDGKSSLVYAGVIPNASAGFFRAEYNNWLFVDFRPERNPLNNLALALSEKINVSSGEINNQLQYGFSSLVNLYKSTTFFVDKNGEQWKNADDIEKRRLRNQAANLFILADQFEEFFTNQENYSNGKPSVSAYTTVNLLLETARLAIKEKLPIYIVCTMRSDFISQCVAFKGLPEFIGFSQFFVPRLKRNELQQVIEEPAKLSGGKISKRLVEVLINELRDGFDQLPVLQHCMKSLWQLADSGKSELDLIHLVKLAGMSPKYLLENDKQNFESWFKKLEEYRKPFYENPSLSNVLNSHATHLYLTAYDYYIENADWSTKNVTKDDVFFIIKTSFQCLTKIDEGRAVRNRMTLREITQIINRPHITVEIVCGVMNIFRLPLSTFIRPFVVPEDVATQYLAADTDLDITHESLIRNWELLKTWEDEEYQTLANFQDFKTQLQRWCENEKSSKFLLSAGNLAHFQDWYAKSNLNAYWIAKYDNSQISPEERFEKSAELALLSKTFLDDSHKHILRSERAKRVSRYITAISAIVIILVLSGFTYWALREKQNAQKQRQIAIEETEKTKEAKRLAEQQQKLAEQSAIAANIARNQSDSARAIAEKMRLLADGQTQIAKSESEKANNEKKRADEQLVITQQQKNIAENERKKAVAASDTAKRLSYLAIAQALTFKADQNYDDVQINLLLAYFAYQLNKENGGKLQDQSVFQALTSALNYFGLSPVVFSSSNPLKTITLTKQNTVERLSDAGLFSVFDISAKKVLSEKIFDSKMPVNEAFNLNGKILISYENYDVALWNTQTAEKLMLTGYTDFVRACIYLENSNLLITGTRDKKIHVHYFKENTSQIVETQSRITNLAVLPNQTSFVSGYSNGEILVWDIKTMEKRSVSNTSNRITALQISPDGKKIIAATASGKIRIIAVDDFAKTTDFTINEAMIDAIAVDAKSELLAVSSADRTIRIYQLANLNAKPFIINKHNQPAKSISFSPTGTLYAYCADNKLRSWETNNETLAKMVFDKITRNLSPLEWDKFVGKEVEYKKVK